ncbi:MAG TPA: hypothetical protein VFQ06_03050, partial [Nitrospira sp.]|nr:hypothetical protein [Nitrospira sp.]
PPPAPSTPPLLDRVRTEITQPSAAETTWGTDVAYGYLGGVETVIGVSERFKPYEGRRSLTFPPEPGRMRAMCLGANGPIPRLHRVFQVNQPHRRVRVARRDGVTL